MTSVLARQRARQAQRLRARGTWAFVLAAVGIVETVVGVFQHASRRTVTFPGRPPLQGSDATAALLVLFVISLGFAAIGLVFRRRARRALVFLPFEEVVLEAVADTLSADAGAQLRRQMSAVGYVQRPLDWTEVGLYTSRDASEPWPETALFADRSDDLKIARVRFAIGDEEFTTDLHAVRGHAFSLVTRPSPRKAAGGRRAAAQRPAVVEVEILADPSRPAAPDEPVALPPDYLEFVAAHGAGRHGDWTVLAPSDVYRISLTSGDYHVLAERGGEEYVLADDVAESPGLHRCKTDGEPAEITGLDDVVA